MSTTEGFALFDPYRTIVSNVKDISPYVRESIMNIYGVIADVDLRRYEGLTAKQVAKAVLLDNGFPEKEIEPRLDRYLEDLPYSYYNVAWSDSIRITEGSMRLLDEMNRRGVLVGMATGDSERIAKMRLDKVGMGRYFSVGAYAEDGMTFNEILEKGLERVEEQGLQKEDGILVVADPVFASIGKTTGMRVVAVESGRYGARELKASGAELIVKDLREGSRILQKMVG